MNQKFMIREFASIQKLKMGLGKDKSKQQEELKQSLGHLSECVTEMTKEIKDMKKGSANKIQVLEESSMEETKATLKNLVECVIQMTREIKEMKKENQDRSRNVDGVKTEQTQNTLKYLNGYVLQMTKQMKTNELKRIQIPYAPPEGSSINLRMEKRFQDVNLPVPELNQVDTTKREQLTLNWITELCKAVFSIGFNLYESGVLDINKVKAYCSQNLIRNFIKFSKINNPTPEEIGKINDFLVDDLLPYSCLKYPESEEAETSAKFSSGLIERDDMDNNDYDLVYKSGVDFSYQESGNYNSQIMKFLNYIISLPEKIMSVKYSPEITDKLKENNEEKEKEKKPLNKLFFEDMESIFRMVEIEENTLQMQMFDPKNPDQAKKLTKKTEKNQPKQENGKEDGDGDEEAEKQRKRKEKEYRDKVISYTTFQIGQKLSKNLKPFSNSDIESGNLTLGSSDVIRVLTKWAEELEKCYKREYFQERDAPFKMKNGSQIYLSSGETNGLIDFFSRQSENIDAIREQIRQNNNKNQSMLMGQETYQRLVRLSEGEASVGQFASSIFKNNITYLISYLNALIHGINQSANSVYWREKEKAPQLITFSIGDLMRCKCCSKENQIIALYKQIERRHRQPESGIKIIRVKNRLNRGNKDILMNLLYRGEMVVEMQLVIKSDKSKFIECSYNFNHYLYELKRAQFGPIMEMCNVWMNKDSKGKFFLEKMEKLNVRNKKKVEQGKQELKNKFKGCCLKNKKQMKLPFRCSLCDCFFSASSLLGNNIQCKKCQTFTCYLCQLQISNIEMEKFLEQIPQLKNDEIVPYQNIQNEGGGVLVNLKSTKKKKPLVFITSKHKKKFYMFKCNEAKKDINLVQKFESQKIPASFLKQHLVLTASALKNKIMKFNQKYEIQIQKYFTEEYLKEAYKTEKTSISLKDQVLTKQMLEIQKIVDWPHIKKINFSQNRDMNLQKIMEKFPNVEVAVLNFSKFSSIYLESSKKNENQKEKRIKKLDPEDDEKTEVIDQSHPATSHRQLGYLKHLKQLQIRKADIWQFPQYLCSAKQLQKLTITSNNLTKLPPSIIQLQKLQLLYMGSNLQNSLPENFGRMKSLRILDISSNIFMEIPDCLYEVVQLTELSVVNNEITQLPDRIGNLKNLRKLNVSGNKIINIAETIGNLTQLRVFLLQGNQLESLPQNFVNLVNLQQLSLQNNQLKSLPERFGNLTNLNYLDLRINQLKQLPQSIRNLTNLQKLHLMRNKLELLPQDFGRLTKLQILNLNYNKLTQLPEELRRLSKLYYVNLSDNMLRNLPEFTGDCLEELNLSNNYLEQLPLSMSNLKSLKNLNISENKFTVLPGVIKDLTNLKCIDFLQNKIAEIPSWLFTMQNLNNICFSVLDNLTLPTNIAELRGNLQQKLQIYIQYVEKYQGLVLEIQKQSADKIEIKVKKIEKYESGNS